MEQFDCDLQTLADVLKASIACETCRANDRKFTTVNEYANGLFGFVCENCDDNAKSWQSDVK